MIWSCVHVTSGRIETLCLNCLSFSPPKIAIKLLLIPPPPIRFDKKYRKVVNGLWKTIVIAMFASDKIIKKERRKKNAFLLININGLAIWINNVLAMEWWNSFVSDGTNTVILYFRVVIKIPNYIYIFTKIELIKKIPKEGTHCVVYHIKYFTIKYSSVHEMITLKHQIPLFSNNLFHVT